MVNRKRGKSRSRPGIRTGLKRPVSKNSSFVQKSGRNLQNNEVVGRILAAGRIDIPMTAGIQIIPWGDHSTVRLTGAIQSTVISWSGLDTSQETSGDRILVIPANTGNVEVITFSGILNPKNIPVNINENATTIVHFINDEGQPRLLASN